MFELITLVLFVWMFIGVIRLTFKVAWGLAKVAAVVLFVLAIPALIGALLMASGIVLLVPLALVGAAFGILRACV